MQKFLKQGYSHGYNIEKMFKMFKNLNPLSQKSTYMHQIYRFELIWCNPEPTVCGQNMKNIARVYLEDSYLCSLSQNANELIFCQHVLSGRHTVELKLYNDV